MLKLENVSKIYQVGTFGGKELRAVNDVTFDVGDGEVVSVIGESGSGKSTIGKMILRLIPRTTGTITVDGVDISTLKGEDLRNYYRKVQGVFQDPFSSYNPIFKADRIFSIIKDEFFPQVPANEWEGRVRNSLKSVGLNPDQVLDKFPHQLSGGQLQRLLIARALLLDIRLLIADELISMLDASTRIDVLNLLADLKSTGLSILFITHDLSLGYYLSDRSVILYRGCIVEMGSTEKIYAQPMHPYTQMLMSAVPRLDRKWDKTSVELKSELTGPRTGCVYFDRCPVAEKNEECTNERPVLVEVEPDHFVACCKCAELQPQATLTT
ncbi:MAG: ABC transporter ATP-binding protein [Anaerolineaceae bacterium]|nr:ABC transporter ATP-binding protein [Anaerolineaceae bacterium]